MGGEECEGVSVFGAKHCIGELRPRIPFLPKIDSGLSVLRVCVGIGLSVEKKESREDDGWHTVRSLSQQT